MTGQRRTLAGLVAVALLAALPGCDPTLNLWGSLLPAWVLCLTLAVMLAAALRWLFAAGGLERHLGPLVIVYPCLVLLLACLVWLVLFRA
jgi:YtcA family